MAGCVLLRNVQNYASLLGVGLFLTILAGCGGGGSSPTPTPQVTVSVIPTTASVASSGTQDFTATVSNSTNKAVNWSVQEGTTGGTITSAGTYTAPVTAGTYHVLASSMAAPSSTALATVTVHVTVAITPVAVTVSIGKTTTFSATVVGSTNKAVTWSIQEGAAGGQVDNAGNYTAPVTPGAYHIIATSQVDPTQNATATITVVAGSATGTIN